MQTPQGKMSTAAEVLDRLKMVLGLMTDAALAQKMRVDPSTITTWRRRNSTPYAECIRVARDNFINLDWLLTGSGLSHGTIVPGAIDREILAISIELASRRAGQPKDDLSAMMEANEVAGYYDSVSKRFAEVMRQYKNWEDRRRALAALRAEFALPEERSDDPPKAKGGKVPQ